MTYVVHSLFCSHEFNQRCHFASLQPSSINPLFSSVLDHLLGIISVCSTVKNSTMFQLVFNCYCLLLLQEVVFSASGEILLKNKTLKHEGIKKQNNQLKEAKTHCTAEVNSE